MLQRMDPGDRIPDPPREETAPFSDLDAFRNWQARRNAARQQIRRLSPRELQVVSLVSLGLVNKSIADRLQISVKTIEKHRANAARKMGVGSTAEMVRITVEADQLTESRTAVTAATAPRPVPDVETSHNEITAVADNRLAAIRT